MRTRVNRACLVVSCTERKRLPVPNRLHLGTVGLRDPDRRAKAWIRRLEKTRAELESALDLYAGEHWSVARTVPTVAKSTGMSVQLWIASAGYGLVRSTDFLKPYSATFLSDHPDSASLGSGTHHEFNRRWWASLAKWAGPSPGSARSLTALARMRPRDHLIVAVGATYLRALEGDLLSARDHLVRPDLLVILATRCRLTELKANWLPISSSLRPALGGSLFSLNVRAARWLLSTASEHNLEIAPASALLSDVRVHVGAGAERRKRSSDAAITQFIRRELQADTNRSRARLLRQLRREGGACEQRRFSRLYGLEVMS
jgi:hypothetical protein